jgi:two-component system NarL family sensor kinase
VIRPAREQQAAGDGAAPRLARVVAQFALSGLLAAALVAVAGVLALRHAGTRESIRDAWRLTQAIGETAIEPRLTRALVDGDPTAVRSFDRLVRTRVIRDPVFRVKLWSAEGRIVYSDEPRLIGLRFPLDAEERRAIAGHEVAAGVSDLSGPENAYERRAHKLLEVYMPVRVQGGTPLLFETYLRYGSVAATGRRVWLMFAPALIAGLLVLWLVQLPLALSLARRLRAGHDEREALLLRALNASDAERRRIAGDLHDGVVQSLAGTSYSLTVAADRAASAPRAEVEGLLRRGAEATRQAMRQLRSLLVEIHPPNLAHTGLEPALSDLAAGLGGRRIPTVVDVEADLPRLSADGERLLFRAAQEALRNVADHSGATRCTVTVGRTDGGVELVVADDGVGFDPGTIAGRRAEGHLGLTLLVDRAAEAGGALDLDTAPGEGARVRLRLPA